MKPFSFTTLCIFIKKSPESRRIYLLLIVFFVALTFHNILLNDFSYDDNIVIVSNQRELANIWNIPSLFTKGYFLISKEATYRPIVTISYILDQYAWGFNPLGYHLTNLFLHLINSVMLFYFLSRLCKNDLSSIISTILYVVHPALTEVVNSIGFREDLIATVFVLISMLFYIRGAVLFSVISYGAALLSKESAFPLPVVIIAYDYLYKNKLILRRYWPYLLISGFYLYLRFYLLTNPIEEILTSKLMIFTKLASIPSAFFYYTKLLLFPFSLTADYANFSFMLNPSFCITVIVLLCVVILVILIKNNIFDKASVFGIIWFFTFLSPVLNLIPIVDPFAERFIYLPSVGFMLCIGHYGMRNIFLRPRFILFMLIAIIFSTLAFHRNKVWQSEELLWRDTSLKSPRSYRATMNLSILLINKREYNAAITLNKNYFKLEPGFAQLYNNLGNAYSGSGDNNLAIRSYERAIYLNPTYVQPLLNLAMLYKRKGEFSKALGLANKTISIEPNNPEGHNYLAIVYADQGLFDKAMVEFKQAIKENPYIQNVHYSLGLIYESKGKNVMALKQYAEELSINPFHAKARIAIGRLYYNNGRRELAKREFLAVLREEPDNEEARESLHKLRLSKER